MMHFQHRTGPALAARAVTLTRPRLAAAPPGCLPAQLGQSRWLYMMLWMAKHGNGLVPPRNIIVAAKRLRVT